MNGKERFFLRAQRRLLTPPRRNLPLSVRPSNVKQTQVLLVEQIGEAADGVRDVLQSNGALELDVVHDLQSARTAIAAATPDLVIANSRLADGKVIELLPADKGQRTFPLVILTEKENAHEAVEAIKAGVVDYVVKSPEVLNGLHEVITRAQREWEKIAVEQKADRLKSRLSSIALIARDFVGIANKSGNMLFVNGAGRGMLGITETEPVSKYKIHDFFPEWKVATLAREGVLRRIADVNWTKAKIKTRDGRTIVTPQTVLAHVSMTSEIQYFTVLARDITDRERLEDKLDTLFDRLQTTHKKEMFGKIAASVARQLDSVLSALADGNGTGLDKRLCTGEASSQLAALNEKVAGAKELVKQLLAYAAPRMRLRRQQMWGSQLRKLLGWSELRRRQLSTFVSTSAPTAAPLISPPPKSRGSS